MEKNKLHVNWDNRAQLLFGTADTSVMGRKHPMEQTYLNGAADFQEALLREISKLAEKYGTMAADMNLYDLKEIVENLKPE